MYTLNWYEESGESSATVNARSAVSPPQHPPNHHSECVSQFTIVPQELRSKVISAARWCIATPSATCEAAEGDSYVTMQYVVTSSSTPTMPKFGPVLLDLKSITLTTVALSRVSAPKADIGTEDYLLATEDALLLTRFSDMSYALSRGAPS